MLNQQPVRLAACHPASPKTWKKSSPERSFGKLLSCAHLHRCKQPLAGQAASGSEWQRAIGNCPAKKLAKTK